MTSFLIISQILVFTHIAFGELTGASLLWTTKELISPSDQNHKIFKVTLWIAFVAIMLAWIAGGFYYLFYYPAVKPVIKEGPEAWAHGVFMEAKEHIFFFLPVLVFTLTSLAHKKTASIFGNRTLWKKYLALTVFTTFLVFSIAIMGYMITWGARTALWLKSGL